LQRLFGSPANQKRAVEAVIGVCGGHYRDLLGLLRNVVARASTDETLPVTQKLVLEVIAAARRDFMPIAEEDAAWLVKIAAQRASALPSTDPGPVTRLARFLDSHSVLYFVNGDEWYDVHPLVREEAERVAAAASTRPPQPAEATQPARP
jgi:hypothetical protein